MITSTPTAIHEGKYTTGPFPEHVHPYCIQVYIDPVIWEHTVPTLHVLIMTKEGTKHTTIKYNDRNTSEFYDIDVLTDIIDHFTKWCNSLT